MEKITFTCETITPMFLAGADGQTPELRAPSIKGALRFWWRACNGHLKIDEMKEVETYIFGGTSPARKSQVIIQILKELTETSNAAPLPHRENQRGYWTNPAFTPNQKFVVQLLTPATILGSKQNEIFNSNQLIGLFKIISMLGGIGKRVRRGFGSFSIQSIEVNGKKIPNQDVISIKEIHQNLSILNPSFFQLNRGKINFNFNGKTSSYPFIKEIEIGKSQSNILKKIGQITHDFKGKDRYAYEASMGHASRGRFASPIFVSLVNENTPVITTLNTVPDKNRHQVSRIMQEDFKTAIFS